MNIVYLIFFVYFVLSRDSFARGDSVNDDADNASCDEPVDESLDRDESSHKDHHNHSPRGLEEEKDDADANANTNTDAENFDIDEDDDDDEEEEVEHELHYNVWERTEYTVDDFVVAGIKDRKSVV